MGKSKANRQANSPTPPPLHEFKQLLTRRALEHRQNQLERSLDRLATDVKSVANEPVTLGVQDRRVPPFKVMHKTFRLWQKLVPFHIRSELGKEVGALAEEHQAGLSWLYVVKGERLEALRVHGYAGSLGRDVPLDGPGIVPLVARTQEAYCVGNVSAWRDPHYIPYSENTRSVQAVPIVFRGRLLGVLKQESSYPGAFSPATAKALEQRAVRLVRHLSRAGDLRSRRWRPLPVEPRPPRLGLPSDARYRNQPLQRRPRPAPARPCT